MYFHIFCMVSFSKRIINKYFMKKGLEKNECIRMSHGENRQNMIKCESVKAIHIYVLIC